MNVQKTGTVVQSFDLLPPSFRYRHRLRGVLWGWMTFVCFLIAVLLGVTTVVTMRAIQASRVNQQIASTAIPLLDLRRDVIRLQEANKQRQQWCRWVQSAKPDDSMIQVLAAIAAASQTIDQSPAGEQQITVDAVSLRLPIEFPLSAETPPPWAVPFMTIVARPASSALVQPWIERLNSLDRITAASIAEEDDDDDVTTTGITSVRLTARPVTGRVHP